ETDARDDYFSRRIEGGQFTLTHLSDGGMEQKVSFVGPSLRRGVATVMVTLPDGVEVGAVQKFLARTKDTRSDFQNRIDATVRPWSEHREGGKKREDRKPPTRSDGKERERPQEFAMPKIEPIYKELWTKFGFDEHTAMQVGIFYDDANEEHK